MNAKSLPVALALSLSAALSLNAHAEASRVDHIVDLPAVTVRPDAALRAELAATAAPRVAHVVDLPAVTVRPDAALRAELAARAARERVALAAARLDATEQLAERAAILARGHAQALATSLADNLAVQARGLIP